MTTVEKNRERAANTKKAAAGVKVAAKAKPIVAGKTAAAREKLGAGKWQTFRQAVVKEGPGARIRMIRSGTAATVMVGAAKALGLPRESIFDLAGISPATAARKIAADAVLDPQATERLARLADIEAQAEDVFGDPARATQWLRAVNLGLGGQTPLSMLDTDVGTREVSRVLAAIAYGGAA